MCFHKNPILQNLLFQPFNPVAEKDTVCFLLLGHSRKHKNQNCDGNFLRAKCKQQTSKHIK